MAEMSLPDFSGNKRRMADAVVGVTTVAFSKSKSLVDRLLSMGFKTVKINPEGRRLDRKELLEFLKDCDAAIIGLDKIDASVLEHLPVLKVISKYGVGLDNINMDDCARRGVEIRHTPGVNKRSVSELALGCMLGLLRNIYVTSAKLKAGEWCKCGGTELSGKTVGIIGVGHVGKDLVSLLKPFHCRILVNDIIPQDEYYRANDLTEVDKDTIYKESDVVTIHTPLTPETENMTSGRALSMMKASAILINAARGGIVDLKSLKRALLEGKLGGAALDVYDKEPPDDMELLAIKNLINTPHIGGNSMEAVRNMGLSAIDNLVEFYKR